MFGVQTRAYRVLLALVNIAGITAGGITQFGPGLHLSAAVILIALAVANGVIVAGRQILDGSTPSMTGTPVPIDAMTVGAAKAAATETTSMIAPITSGTLTDAQNSASAPPAQDTAAPPPSTP